MESKTILFLGGSSQQVIAIKTAKLLGYRTVLCDYLIDNPGQEFADVYYNVSTTDIPAIEEIARKEKVDGILPYASDPAALPASIVCEKLGLSTTPSSSVRAMGLKHEFRKFLMQKGFTVPKSYVFDAEQDTVKIINGISGLKFPIIIKPTDSSGSKGITKITERHSTNLRETIEKAVDWAKSYSRNHKLIAEEFIERSYPYIIGGDIFVEDGKIILYGDMDCLRDNEGKGLIPVGKKWPSGLKSGQRNVVYKELQRLVEALCIIRGEFNIELILDYENNVHFLELGPRAGGNMIPIQLSDAFGVNLVEANIHAALGKPSGLKPVKKEGCYMHFVLHSYANGLFDSIEYSPEIQNKIYRECIYKKKGDQVEFFDGAGKALGIIFLHFDSRDEMDEFCQKREEWIKIKLKKE